MGRNNKYYYKTLHQQAYDRLTNMLKAGEGRSKRGDMLAGDTKDKIYSFNTYNTYRQHVNYFTRWMAEHHPECTTLRKAEKYVNEWLRFRTEQVNRHGDHLSAWTIQTEAASLNKLFGIDKADPDRFQPPQRNRKDIKRSRYPVDRDKKFNEKKNAELKNFCQGTGCRRNVLTKLEGRDYWTRDRMINEIRKLSKQKLSVAGQKHMAAIKEALKTFPDQDAFLHHRKDKGGKFRFSPIIGKNKEQIIQRMQRTGSKKKVWPRVHSCCDVHGYRGDYATLLYRTYARDVSKIPYDRINRGTGRPYQSEVYICRKDEAGRRLDKAAMLKASRALGHNRIDVVANNYIRDL